MTAKKALIVLASSVLLILGGIAVFNYAVDAECYYRCPQISLSKNTINTYYQMGQRVLSHPDAEVVIIGSSRGETTSPLWINSVTGKRTLNLSAAGAELATKKAVLNIALEQAPIKKVIWLADYFELIDETKDAKIKNTPALKKYFQSEGVKEEWWSPLKSLQGLIDHNTTDASLRMRKRKNVKRDTQGNYLFDEGTHHDIKFEECAQETYLGKETPESLKTKVHLLYQSYLQNVIRLPQRPAAWEDFKMLMESLTQKNIEVAVVVIPYHPEFLAKLKLEHPEIYQRHLMWISQLETLKSKNIRVLNYLESVPGDDGSTKYWNDGVHFTCHSAMKMLNTTISSWK